MVNWKSIVTSLTTFTYFTWIEATVYIKNCDYSASNTATATQNYTICQVDACFGDTLIFDGCSCSGDTFFRLYDSVSVQQVAYGDQECGSCAKVQYSSGYNGCQTYTLRMGCWSSWSCSATVVVSKIPYTPSAPTERIVSVSYDGPTSELNVIAAPTDTVSFTATYSPFSIYFMDFGGYGVNPYSHVFESEGTYPYTITDAMYRSDVGIVSIRTPTLYNIGIYYYYLNPGDFMRWQWSSSESPPSYPTYFYGSMYYYPGMNRYGNNYYDYIFALPGYYYWTAYNGWGGFTNYYFSVSDPVTSPHNNFIWGGNYMNSYIYNYKDLMLVFYSTGNHKQNIRITNSKGNVVWVSQDLNFPGDHVAVILPVGVYTATSDYDPLPLMTINVYEYNDDGEKNKRLIPKSLIRAAELAFVVFGVVGLTDLIVDTVRSNTPKLPKLPNLPKPIGNIGDHISIHALDEAEERARPPPS